MGTVPSAFRNLPLQAFRPVVQSSPGKPSPDGSLGAGDGIKEIVAGQRTDDLGTTADTRSYGSGSCNSHRLFVSSERSIGLMAVEGLVWAP